MNAVAPQKQFSPDAADAPRHRFTVDEVMAMSAAGLLDDKRVELIEGELIEMPSDGPRHRDYAAVLGRWLIRALDDDFVVMPATTLVLSTWNAPEPDWYVFAAATPTADVRGPDVLLALEQSETSVRRDLGWKADLYARHGIRDYWAIELETGRTYVHRDPTPDGYRTVTTHERDASIEALLIPGLSLRIADLPRVNG